MFKGDARVHEQAEVDALAGFTRIDGDLWIKGGPTRTEDDRLSLRPLACLSAVDGHLRIDAGRRLASLEGLEGVVRVGRLSVYGGDALLSLRGLDSLTSVAGMLGIADNDLLTDLSGLDAIVTVKGDVSINYNDTLTSLNGLGSLETVSGKLYIFGNRELSWCVSTELAERLGKTCSAPDHRIVCREVCTCIGGGGALPEAGPNAPADPFACPQPGP